MCAACSPRLFDVDPEWERAIEAALGQDIQAIVVESASIVPEVRDLLGDSNGRVSLLPLEAHLKPPVDDAPIDLPSNARGLSALRIVAASQRKQRRLTRPDRATAARRFEICQRDADQVQRRSAPGP